MILAFLYGGADVFQYGLRNSVMVIVLALEAAAAVLGIIFGLLIHSGRKRHIGILVPGIIGCLMFVFINTLGKTILSDAHIWLPFLAEDLAAFSAIAYVVSIIKKRRAKRV